MRQLLSVLLAFLYMITSDPLVASNQDDDNDAVLPTATVAGSNLELPHDPYSLLNHMPCSFNADALRGVELGLSGPLQIRYVQAIEALAQQTGNPKLFKKDHACDYAHFTLKQLEDLVDKKTLQGALDPNTKAGQAYFELKTLLQDKSITEVVRTAADLALCPPLEGASNLAELNLCHNQLTALPSLDTLTKLERIDLSWNNLTALPSLDTLTKLERIDLSWNNLTALPSLGGWTSLQVLDLDDTQMNQVGILRPLITLLDRQKAENKEVVRVYSAWRGLASEEDLRSFWHNFPV